MDSCLKILESIIMINLSEFTPAREVIDEDDEFWLCSWSLRRGNVLITLDVREHKGHPVTLRRAFVNVWEGGDRISSGAAYIGTNDDLYFENPSMNEFFGA